jgi:proliferating cell nuclear antigen PCNA
MKLTLKDSCKVTKFSAIFQHLKQLVDCIAIYFSEDGMYIQGMDNTQICLFECKILNTWFDEYEFANNVDDPRVCMNTAILHKVISAVDEKHAIQISYSGSTDILNIKFADPSDNMYNKCFEISLMDFDSDLMNIPREESHVDLTIDTSKFSKLVSQLLIFSNVLTLTFSDQDIKFRAEGSEGAMSSKIDLDDVNEYAIGEDSVLTQSYSLTYINLMCNFCKLNKSIVMGFSDNMPMSLTYDLDEDKETTDDEMDEVDKVDKEKKCFVGFYLAPKIDE